MLQWQQVDLRSDLSIVNKKRKLRLGIENGIKENSLKSNLKL
jgi:hypothetical protein